jgi:hypothetical protein
VVLPVQVNHLRDPILKIPNIARCQWLMPIILATQAIEIRRILVRSQPGQIGRETLS